MTQDHGEVLLYQTEGGHTGIEVRLEQETVWLTHRQMAELFDTTPENVIMHLKRIFTDQELDEGATTKDFLVVRKEGTRQVRRELHHYNLDAIISVGYRVNSKRGVRFRQWATQRLKDHLVKGYTLHERRLRDKGIGDLTQTIQLLSRTLNRHALVDDTGKAILDVVEKYARSWRLLVQYDEQELPKLKGHAPQQQLDPPTARQAIQNLKNRLTEKREAGDLFGMDQANKLPALLDGLQQSFSDEPLYPSAESRAAHLLYFIIKDHPFTDGNKRIGSLLFLLYLETNGLLNRLQINDTALVALALLIAESAPEQKELMIRLVEHLVAGE